MNRFGIFLSIFSILALLGACSGRDYSGTYTGYAWKDEIKGVSLEEAKEKIVTTLTLDKDSTILDAKMDFLVQKSDGSWSSRLDESADIKVDFTVTPTPAVPPREGVEYKAGQSMFQIKTASTMSLYAVAVAEDRTLALAIAEPLTRYLFESKLPPKFDYNQPISALTIASGLSVPTVRLSAGGLIKPKSWDEFKDKTFLDFYRDTYLFTGRGVFQGLTRNDSIKAYLERLGVRFDDRGPKPTDPLHGFTGNGGWKGNYEAIRNFLIGKKATELTSLVDWSNPRYAGAINENNFFGVDVKAGATATVQNSVDGIAGATVRMSRESNSYQRALVAAGILTEDKVIKGRF